MFEEVFVAVMALYGFDFFAVQGWGVWMADAC